MTSYLKKNNNLTEKVEKYLKNKLMPRQASQLTHFKRLTYGKTSEEQRRHTHGSERKRERERGGGEGEREREREGERESERGALVKAALLPLGVSE